MLLSKLAACCITACCPPWHAMPHPHCSPHLHAHNGQRCSKQRARSPGRACCQKQRNSNARGMAQAATGGRALNTRGPPALPVHPPHSRYASTCTLCTCTDILPDVPCPLKLLTVLAQTICTHVLCTCREVAEEHYKDLKDKPFFPDLIGYILSGPVVGMVRLRVLIFVCCSGSSAPNQHAWLRVA